MTSQVVQGTENIVTQWYLVSSNMYANY